MRPEVVVAQTDLNWLNTVLYLSLFLRFLHSLTMPMVETGCLLNQNTMNSSFLTCGLIYILFNIITLSLPLWIFYKLIFILPSETLHNKPIFLFIKQLLNIWSSPSWSPKLKCPTPYLFYMLITLTFFFPKHLPLEAIYPHPSPLRP